MYFFNCKIVCPVRLKSWEADCFGDVLSCGLGVKQIFEDLGKMRSSSESSKLEKNQSYSIFLGLYNSP